MLISVLTSFLPMSNVHAKMRDIMELSSPLFPELFPSTRRKHLNAASYSLKATDIHTFFALWELKFATVEHILRFRRLSKNSVPKLRQQLVILSGQSKKVQAPKYLQRFYQSRATPHGTLPFVYGLTELSKKELAAKGYDITAFGRIKKVEKRLPADIEHHFAVNDFYLAARELEQIEPRLETYEFHHDWKLKHFSKKFAVEIWKGNTRLSPYFVPDGLFEFRVNLGTTMAPFRMFVEMDMGTEGWDTIKKKIACYCEFFASGTYAKELGNVRNVIVLFATPLGSKRVEKLRRWAHEQFDKPLYTSRSSSLSLTPPAKEEHGKFLFASVQKDDTGVVDPIQTFLSPVCLPLFREQPQAAIRLP
jgi:Replication-relaxation